MSLADLLFPPTTTASGWASPFGTGSQTIPNPVSNWFDTNSGTLAGLGSVLSGIGAGLGSGGNDPRAMLQGVNQGLLNANPQAAFQQAATNQQITKTQQAQNATIQWLKDNGNADLVPMAQAGDVQGAFQTAIARKQGAATGQFLNAVGGQSGSPAIPALANMAATGAITPSDAVNLALPQPVGGYTSTAFNRLTGQATPLAGNPSDIASMIMSSQAPPEDTLRLLPRALASQVVTDLQQRGYNLSQGALNFKAAQTTTNALNGVSFTRLKSAVDTTSKSLDIIDSLADQWKNLKLPGGTAVPALNAANLSAAKQGLYGQEAMSIATQLDGQISDSAAEVGSIFRNGNTPTDQALQQASTQLSSSWSTDTLHAMTNMIRQNMQKRMQSYQDATTGFGAGNPYLPGSAPTAPLTKSVGGVLYTSPDNGQTWYTQ